MHLSLQTTSSDPEHVYTDLKHQKWLMKARTTPIVSIQHVFGQ